MSGSNCDEVRTTRAFLIMALVLAGCAFVMAWLGYHAYDDFMFRAMTIVFSLLSFACGLIAWSVWVAMGQRDFDSNQWNWGWATGLALGAWLLPLAASIACMMPSPLHDLKTGELLAHDTMRGRRGSFADVFTKRFWMEGGHWGGAEPVTRDSGPGTSYEERRGPPGTGYRETTSGYGTRDPERGTYGYHESPTERERLERERRTGTGGGLTQALFGSKHEQRTSEPYTTTHHTTTATPGTSREPSLAEETGTGTTTGV